MPVVDDDGILEGYLGECREAVLEEVQRIVPSRGPLGPVLYDLMLEYPLRAAKGLRPALCIATCRALGGRRHDAMRTAAVLELYHNAFLIHDDVEDGSPARRGLPTLHSTKGAPIAINVGDAMLALTLEPLLENMRDLGMGRALRIMKLIARMARETAEGQALELDWMERGMWDLDDADYLRMVHKKSSWYTFLAPILLGATIARAEPPVPGRLGRFATPLGASFQIRDDLLSLIGDESKTGKQRFGDIEEGKRTLMLLHLMRAVSPADRAQLLAMLEDRATRAENAERVFEEMKRHGSIDYAAEQSRRRANRAAVVLEELSSLIAPSVHRSFLMSVVGFVVDRPY